MAKVTKAAIKVGAEVTTDAAGSAANQMVTKGEINLKDVAIDATAGQLIGNPVGKIVKGKAQASKTAKVLNRKADRAKRVATGEGTRQSRNQASATTTKKATEYGSGRAAAAGAASSNAASTTVKKLKDEK